MRVRGLALKSKELIRVSYEILEQIQPASVRSVSRLLVYARESEIIPWEWIVDETRAPERVSAWSSPADYGEAVLRSYRKDFWRHQENQIEIWSEKGTVRGVLSPVLDEFAVTFSVKHGFDSATSINNVAVDTKIEDQAEFVRWWNETVRRPGGKEAQSIVADRGQLVSGDAESLTGITKQQVSRWSKYLKDRETYRATLFGKAYKAAMACAAEASQLVQQSISNEHYTPAQYIEAAELESLRSFKWNTAFSDQSENRGSAP